MALTTTSSVMNFPSYLAPSVAHPIAASLSRPRRVAEPARAEAVPDKEALVDKEARDALQAHHRPASVHRLVGHLHRGSALREADHRGLSRGEGRCIFCVEVSGVRAVPPTSHLMRIKQFT